MKKKSTIGNELDESFLGRENSTALDRGAKTCWQRFEDYFWFHNHKLFEEHASQKKAYISTPINVILIRIFIISVMIFDFTCAGVAGGLNIANYRFLTKWGLWLSNIIFFAGLYLSPYKKVSQVYKS